MSRGHETLLISNTQAIATATTYTMFTLGTAEHSTFSVIISHTATTSVDVNLVAVNAGISGAIPLTPANMLGNTASAVNSDGTPQVYRLENGYFEKIKLKVSATATIPSGAVTVAVHLGRID